MSDTAAPEAPAPKRIYFLVEAMWACAWYRCHTPASGLKRRGHEVVLHDRLDPDTFQHCDIAVFQRPSISGIVDIVKWARAAGKRTIVDIDDDLWNIHPTNPAYASWQQPGRLDTLNECIRTVDAVTVSTPELMQLVRSMNPRTVILPNMLPPEHWPPERVPRASKQRLTIGWAGSPTHAVDLEILAGAIETVLDTYPDVEFVVAGMQEAPFRWHERIRFVERVMIEEYPSLLQQFDIGVIPLVDGRFNRCKSDLKFLEYSMVGIPSVASKVAPYEGSVVHGVNGFLARNPKDWLKYLNRLVADPQLRDDIGSRAREFAETRTVDRNIHLWERAYGISG